MSDLPCAKTEWFKQCFIKQILIHIILNNITLFTNLLHLQKYYQLFIYLFDLCKNSRLMNFSNKDVYYY